MINMKKKKCVGFEFESYFCYLSFSKYKKETDLSHVIVFSYWAFFLIFLWPNGLFCVIIKSHIDE